VHLRCELLDPDIPNLLADLLGHERVRLCSVMDHGPGGQFATLQSYAEKRRRDGWSEREIETRTAELLDRRRFHKGTNRALVLRRARNHQVTVASHDDRTELEIEQNRTDDIAVAEFPVTVEAAAAAHRAGMEVVVGAPNLVRGGSHSGNVAAGDLVAAGTASILASDFVPSSLLPAVSRCIELGLPIWRAMAMVTGNPARLLKLDDRGRIESGLRADFVRLAQSGSRLTPRGTWCCGRRVF
jgi:alpha-D-ribose 1-methylphosphonate 5-triphosphate diphosphatase